MGGIGNIIVSAPNNNGGGGGGGSVNSVTGVEGIFIDNTTPTDPIVMLGDTIDGSSVPFTLDRFLDASMFSLIINTPTGKIVEGSYIDPTTVHRDFAVLANSSYFAGNPDAGNNGCIVVDTSQTPNVGQPYMLFQDPQFDTWVRPNSIQQFDSSGNQYLSLLTPEYLRFYDNVDTDLYGYYAEGNWQLSSDTTTITANATDQAAIVVAGNIAGGLNMSIINGATDPSATVEYNLTNDLSHVAQFALYSSIADNPWTEDSTFLLTNSQKIIFHTFSGEFAFTSTPAFDAPDLLLYSFGNGNWAFGNGMNTAGGFPSDSGDTVQIHEGTLYIDDSSSNTNRQSAGDITLTYHADGSTATLDNVQGLDVNDVTGNIAGSYRAGNFGVSDGTGLKFTQFTTSGGVINSDLVAQTAVLDVWGDLTTEDPLSPGSLGPGIKMGNVEAGAVALDATHYWAISVNGVTKKVLLAA